MCTHLVHPSRHSHYTSAPPTELLWVYWLLDMSWAGSFFPQNCLFMHGIWTNLTHRSMGPSESTSQTASRWLSLFCTAHGRESLEFTMGCPFQPQNCPFACGIWTPMVLWSHPSLLPKRLLDRFSCFCRAHDWSKLCFCLPRRAPGHNAPLIHLLTLALYSLLVYLASPTYFLFSLLIFPYLSTSLRTFSFENRPAPFPGRRS